MNDHILAQAVALAGTSCYVFDIDVLKKRVAFLRAHLPKSILLCYAVKANPFLAAEIAPLTDRLEICSPGELDICCRLGCDPVLNPVTEIPSLLISISRSSWIPFEISNELA